MATIFAVGLTHIVNTVFTCAVVLAQNLSIEYWGIHRDVQST